MTRLCNRQYPMPQALARTSYISILEAQKVDQRPFRSMLIQEWAAFRPGKGFYIRRSGLQALDEFRHADIRRKDPRLPLTRYFDPTACGLTISEKTAPHVVTARASAA
jgi:hypothetical protein